MDLTGGFGARHDGGQEATGLESLHLGDELRQLPPDGFTALLELPPTQALKLLHFTDSPSSSPQAAPIAPPSFASNLALMERPARFSTEHQQNGTNLSGETTTSSSVKTEPAETNSSSQAVNNRSGKRKDSDNKVRESLLFSLHSISRQ